MADESGEPQQQFPRRQYPPQQSAARTGEKRGRDEQVVRKQRRAVFRVPPVSLLTLPLLLFCITPLALTVPGLEVLYVIPVAVIVWVLRVHTLATPEGLTARSLTATRSISWDELSGLSVTEKAAINAVLKDGTTVALPYVRLHHVPVLSLLSNGLIPDPSGALTGENRAETDGGDQDSGDQDSGTAGDGSRDGAADSTATAQQATPRP